MRPDLPRDPYREADLPARVTALREERDRLALELQDVQADLRALVARRERTARDAPWSWARFLLGVSILPGGFLLLALRWMFGH